MITSLFLSVFSSGLYLVFSFLPTVNASPEWFTVNAIPVFVVISQLLAFHVINTVVQIFLVWLAMISGWQMVPLYGWLYGKVRGMRS